MRCSKLSAESARGRGGGRLAAHLIGFMRLRATRASAVASNPIEMSQLSITW